MRPLQKRILSNCQLFLDTTKPHRPKMISTDALYDAMQETIKRPFRVVPFLIPVHGRTMAERSLRSGQKPALTMHGDSTVFRKKIVFLLGFGDQIVEIPSVNLVFFQPEALLGKQVYKGFGDEFPIRLTFWTLWKEAISACRYTPKRIYQRKIWHVLYTG